MVTTGQVGQAWVTVTRPAVGETGAVMAVNDRTLVGVTNGHVGHGCVRVIVEPVRPVVTGTNVTGGQLGQSCVTVTGGTGPTVTRGQEGQRLVTVTIPVEIGVDCTRGLVIFADPVETREATPELGPRDVTKADGEVVPLFGLPELDGPGEGKAVLRDAPVESLADDVPLLGLAELEEIERGAPVLRDAPVESLAGDVLLLGLAVLEVMGRRKPVLRDAPVERMADDVLLLGRAVLEESGEGGQELQEALMVITDGVVRLLGVPELLDIKKEEPELARLLDLT